MISKNDIKRLRALHQKKYRDAEQLFLGEGDKIVREAIEAGAEIEKIYATAEWAENNQQPNIIVVNRKELDQLSQQKTPNQAVALIRKSESSINLDSLKGRCVLALDGVRDPGNMGTLIRIADWFGIDCLLLSPDCVEIHNHKVVQSSMGGIFRVNIHSSNMVESLEHCKQMDMPLLAATMDGSSLSATRSPSSGIIVLGNEANGVSNEIQDLCDLKVRIDGKGGAESLNVAVAGGILANWLTNGV